MIQNQNQEEKHHEQELSLLTLLDALVQRRMLIIKVCTVALVASICYSLTLPNVYSATAKILPPQKESEGGAISSFLSQAGGLAGFSLGGFGGGADLYLAILKSRTLGAAVVERLHLQQVYHANTKDDARLMLTQTAKFQAAKDGIITIVAEDEDPKRAALIANTFIDELGKATVRLNLTKAGTDVAFFEKRLEVVKNDLNRAEDDMKVFSQAHKIVTKVEAQAGTTITAISRLKAEISVKEVQLAALLSSQTEENPDVQMLQAAIRRLKGDLSSLMAKGDGGDAIPTIGAVPGVALEYSRKLRELKTQEAIYEQLTKQYEVAKLKSARDASAVQVLDEAVVPLNKCKPSRTLVVVFATMTAFLGSTLFIFVQRYLAGIPEGDRELMKSIWKSAWSIKRRPC